MISITPEWNESWLYEGAVHPSMYCTCAPSSTMIMVRSNCPMLSALMRKYACSGMSSFTPLGMYTKEPPLHTAVFTAANRLSRKGTTLPKYSRTTSSWSRSPSSIPLKMTPCSSHSFLSEW